MKPFRGWVQRIFSAANLPIVDVLPVESDFAGARIVCNRAFRRVDVNGQSEFPPLGTRFQV